jgi:hypothetical protein
MSSLKSNYINAVHNLKHNLGDNIYVALSGGMDSQATCLSFLDAGIKFKAITMVMSNNFNEPDVKSAVRFANQFNVPHSFIQVDILRFLKSDLHDYSKKYSCPSPQFCTLFYFFESILKLNPSSLIIGGSFPGYTGSSWNYNLSTAQISWRNFKRINKANMIGDFFSYDFDLSLLLMMSFADLPKPIESNYENSLKHNYDLKKMYYKSAGFNVIPQYAKLTGFERLKSHFNKLKSSHGVFNNLFRRPLEKYNLNKIGSLQLPSDTSESLTAAYQRINSISAS